MDNQVSKSKRLPLPDLADIIFLLVLQLTLYLKPDFIFSDGSTGWHLVSGNFILDHHAIPHVDLFSYTFPGKPWVAYEWLSDLIMASLTRIGGLNLLAVAVSSAISLLFMLLYLRCRKYECNFLFVVVLCVLGAIVSSVHWLARPVIFVFFGVYLFATALEDFWMSTAIGGAPESASSISTEVSGNPVSGSAKFAKFEKFAKQSPAIRLLVTLALTMLVWVNTHPGFLIGFAMLGIYLFCAASQALVTTGNTRQTALRRTQTLALATLLTGLTTLCNPYFFQLFVYIHDYLSCGAVLAATDEFASPIFHGDLQPACLEILFGLFISGLAITKRSLSFPYLVMSIAFCHLSLSAKRNMPLVAIILLPGIAQLFSKTIFDSLSAFDVHSESDQISADRSGLQFSDRFKHILQKLRTLNSEFTENERLCNMHLLPWAAFIILAAAAIAGGKPFGVEVLSSTFDHEHKPTQTLKAIQDLHLDPKHGFNFDNWGGYIRYELGIPVFIDDRADFYGENFYSDYGRVVQVQSGWATVLKEHSVNWILFPKNSPLFAALKANPEWKLACEDKASALFTRK
jgi:hypothetical protein